MAVDINKLEIHGKNVNLFSKNTTIYKKYVDIVDCHRHNFAGQRDRVRLQGRMR